MKNLRTPTASSNGGLFGARAWVAAALLLLLVPMARAGDPEKIYWLDKADRSIRRVNLDGSEAETIARAFFRVSHWVALSASDRKLYWTDREGGQIVRADRDGSNVEVVLCSDLVEPTAIAVDPVDERMYWIDEGLGAIRRADLDGSNVEDVVPGGLVDPRGLAVDAMHRKLYWTDAETGRLDRSNLDGSEAETLVADLTEPGAVTLDPAANRVYWIDRNRIAVARLDGTEHDTLLLTDVCTNECGLAADPDAGWLYWVESSRDVIMRARLDGSGIQPFYTTNNSWGLALEAGDEFIYSANGSDVHRVSLDGSRFEIVLEEQWLPVWGAGVSRVTNSIYWYTTGTIYRMDPDGVNAVALLQTEHPARRFAVDDVHGTLYWSTDEYPHASFWRSDLDGSNARQLFRLESAQGLAVDPRNGWMFWLMYREREVWRARLDGTGVETIVNIDIGLNPSRIAVDSLRGKVYWTDSGENHIQRANLDGSEVETVLRDANAVVELAIDEGRGKLYWDSRTAIKRANLDGSEAEVIPVEGLSRVSWIALGPGGPDRRVGDLDGDDVVGATDLMRLLAAWGPCGCALHCLADIDGNGEVDFQDLVRLLDHWS